MSSVPLEVREIAENTLSAYQEAPLTEALLAIAHSWAGRSAEEIAEICSSPVAEIEARIDAMNRRLASAGVTPA